MKTDKITHVSDEKKRIVEEVSNLMKTKKTILVASIKDIPASQFQVIGKKLRTKALVKVLKKNLVFRAIDLCKEEEIKKLKEEIKSDIAMLFSDLDSFDLALELVKNKSPAKAKAGQEAPEDIEIPEGPTELVPGPAISELGALGIQIQIEKGKISIKKSKIIAKKGEKISVAASELMSKLDIKPFSVGFVPIAAFDTKEKKLYLNINIDREKTLNDLKNSFTKSLAFAVEIGYTTEDTIKFLIRRARICEIVLDEVLKKTSEAGSPEKDIEKSVQTPKENMEKNK